MQKLVLIICLLFSTQLMAREKLGEQVQQMMTRIDSCSSSEMVGSIINQYEYLTQSFGRDWRSYYWIAYAHLKKAEFSFNSTSKDLAIDQGLKYIKRARNFNRDHPELDILESLLLMRKIEIDPDARSNRYKFLAKQLLEDAFQKDQLNPRYYYLKGLKAIADTVGNPKNTQVAIEHFKAGEKLFGPHNAMADLADPNWGFEDMQLFLNVLVPNRSFYYNKQGVKVKTPVDVESTMELKDIESELEALEEVDKKSEKKEKAAKEKQEKKEKKEKEKAKKDDKEPKQKKTRNLP